MTTPYITIEPVQGQVILSVGNVVLAASQSAVVLKEGSYPPVLYIPAADVVMERFTKTNKTTHCPHKGDATHWAADLGERTVEVAAWSYEAPDKPVAAPIKGYFGFYLNNLGPEARFDGPGVPSK